MAFKLTYTDKSGNKQAVTFGVRALAENYSRTVRNACIEETLTHAPVIAVCRVQDGTAQAQKEATERFYLGDRAALPGDSEEESEAMAEHFAEARTVGMCAEDAWADWDYSQGGKV